jgi:trigger factor
VSQVVVNIENLSAVKKKMSLEIPWEEVKTQMDAVYREIGKTAKIKGFRPGKIPRQILEKYFKEQAEEETLSQIINKYYWQTLDEKGIVAVSRPEITQDGLKENEPYVFAASFETEPEIDPKNYKNIELEKEEIKISEEDVEKRIDEIRNMFATMEEVAEDRPAGKGDFVEIDFAGVFEGEELPELKGDNYFLEIGSQRFVPGFEDQLIGMKKGENREIKVVFPEDYHEMKFAGKEVVFKILLKNLKAKKLPVLDENFVKNFERYSTLEDFRDDVRKSLHEKMDRQLQNDLKNKITDILLKENEFPVPDALVEKQIYYMMADTQNRMISAGIDEQTALDFTFKMKDKYKEDAEKIVKSFLLLKKIAEKESIDVADEEVEDYIRQIAAETNRDSQSLSRLYENEGKKEALKMELMQKKVFDLIEKHAKIKTVKKEKTNPEVEA